MPGDFRWLAVNTRVHTCYPMRTRGCGCIGRPAFPTPSVFRANSYRKSPGASRRGAQTRVWIRRLKKEARHAGFGPGHPRLEWLKTTKDWDGRVKPGHDDFPGYDSWGFLGLACAF